MKKLFTIVGCLFAFTMVFAQTVRDTVAKVGVVSTQAYTVSVERNVDLVEGAVKKKLKDASLKVKTTEGYIASLEQVFTLLSSEPVNLYFKVEEKGRRNNKVSVITAFAIYTNLNTDPVALHENVKVLLIDMVNYIDKYEAYTIMVEKQNLLKKAEKIWSQAVSSKNIIEKSIDSDKQKIESKQNDIESLRQKIAECEKSIAEYRSRIDENTQKLSEANRKVAEAESEAKDIEAEVEKYRQLSQ